MSPGSSDPHDSSLPPLPRPTRGDVQKLAGWLQALEAEAGAYADLPRFSPQRIKNALRLLKQGQSKEAGQIFRSFHKWVGKKAEQAEREAILAKASAASAAGSSEKPSSPTNETSPSGARTRADLKRVSALIHDLRGPEYLSHTLRRSALSWDSFGSTVAISPYAVPEVPPAVESRALPEGASYFGLFDQLAEAASSAQSDYTLLLESGAALKPGFAGLIQEALSSGNESALYLLRHEDADSGEISPAVYRDTLHKTFTEAQRLPGLLVKTNFLRDQAGTFKRLWHLTPWSMVLRQVQTDDHGVTQLETPAFAFHSHDYQLSNRYRDWAQVHQPNLLPELRESAGEWSMVYHDLVVRVVQENLDYFQDHVGYLAAVQATGVRR